MSHMVSILLFCSILFLSVFISHGRKVFRLRNSPPCGRPRKRHSSSIAVRFPGGLFILTGALSSYGIKKGSGCFYCSAACCKPPKAVEFSQILPALQDFNLNPVTDGFLRLQIFQRSVCYGVFDSVNRRVAGVPDRSHSPCPIIFPLYKMIQRGTLEGDGDSDSQFRVINGRFWHRGGHFVIKSTSLHSSDPVPEPGSNSECLLRNEASWVSPYWKECRF